MAKVRVDQLVEGNLVKHTHGIEDFNSGVDARYVNVTGDTMTGTLNMASTTGVDAWTIKDSSTTKASMKWVGDTVTLDIPSPEPINKIVNPTFDTDLTSWSAVHSYTLNDQFTTDRSAGAVNGTSAEPTGGTRTVVDTTSKLNIGSGLLNFTGVKTTPTAGDPGILYPATSRVAGKVLTNTINMSTVGDYFPLALSLSATGNFSAYSNLGYGIYSSPTGFFAGDALGGHSSGNALSSGITYNFALVLKSTGAYYYIKGGTYTNWTLFWISSSGSSASLYPAISNWATASVFTADNIRIPTATWLPTNGVVYDTFDRADGAIGNSLTSGPDSQTISALAWTGGAISSNKNVITPSLGSDLYDPGAGTFDSGTYGWVAQGTNTIANVSNALEITYVDNANGAKNPLYAAGDLSSNLLLDVWYQIQYDAWTNAGSSITYITQMGSGNVLTYTGFTSTTPVTKTGVLRNQTTNSAFQALYNNNLGAGEKAYWDNITIKPLTLSSLFSTVSTSDADVIADANVTMTAGTQAGLVLNLDSTSSPANFIIVYHDGTSVKVDEAVAGVYTNKQSTTVTYSAGATLRAIREGTKLRVYYNNALIGAELTMTANTNTKHGMFSTYATNSFDNFTLWPRGSGTTKFTDAPFEELTTTRDTGTKYVGTASAKLVAGGVDATFLQSINVGDTVTYTLIGYAYTTGAAVTTADLNLYYNGAVISTSFTDMTGGWYKLTGTLTGANASRDFGVRVKAGKTVYVDSFMLQAGVGTTTTFSVGNSGTGTLHHNWEGTGTFNSGIGTEQAVIVKGASTQTANLTEWQNSSDGVMISFDGVGGAIFNEQGTSTADFRVESDTEANMIFLDANADTDGALYLGGSTNGIKINKGGELTLLGTATVWKDIDFPIIIRNTGANIPSMTTINGNISMPQWQVNDVNMCESTEFIHEWKQNSTVYFHIHLTTNGLDATNRYVQFEIEYGYVTPNGVWVFPATINSGDLLIPANTTDKTMFILSIGSFTPTANIGGHVVARLKRVASSGTAPSGNPWVPMLQLHIECDSIGSKDIATK